MDISRDSRLLCLSREMRRSYPAARCEKRTRFSPNRKTIGATPVLAILPIPTTIKHPVDAVKVNGAEVPLLADIYGLQQPLSGLLLE